jgi:hypothetical protein
MKPLRRDEHDLGSVHYLHRGQACGILEHFACDHEGVRIGYYGSESADSRGNKGLGIGAFADEPLAAREDIGERLEEALQLRAGGRGRDLHGDRPPGELDLDGDGGRCGLHYLCAVSSGFCLALCSVQKQQPPLRSFSTVSFSFFISSLALWFFLFLCSTPSLCSRILDVLGLKPVIKVETKRL